MTFLRPNYSDYPEGNDQVWRFVAPLREFPEVVRYPEVAYGTVSTGIASHGLFISAKCENPDRAWDVFEVLASQELRDLCVWGEEGVNFEWKDGERVPIPGPFMLPIDDPEVFRWQRQFLVIWGFPEYREYDIACAQLEDKEFADEQVASYEPIVELNNKIKLNPGSIPYTPSDNASRKTAEAQASMSTSTINYIMGKLSDEDFDQAIADWEKEYGFIAQEQTEFINSYDKAKAEALGISYTLD